MLNQREDKETKTDSKAKRRANYTDSRVLYHVANNLAAAIILKMIVAGIHLQVVMVRTVPIIVILVFVAAAVVTIILMVHGQSGSDSGNTQPAQPTSSIV